MTLPKLADVVTPLQPHQQRVVDKIQRPDQPGLVVAHGVGSGKTLSAIAAQEALGTPGTAVVPAALQANYKKEKLKHLSGPRQPTHVESMQGVALSGAPTPAPFLVVDEAHRARDPSTKTYKALANNEATKRLLLTGSPFYNHPADLAPLVNLAAGENVLPSQREDFSRKFVRERSVSPGILQRLKGVKPGTVAELNPRTKDALAKQLAKWVDYHPNSSEGFPSTRDETIDVPMGKHQLRVYDALMGKAPYWVAAKVKSGLPPSKQESKELNAFLSAVRQVSNTTRTFSGQVEEPKIQRAYAELTKELEANPESRAVVYSNFLGSGIDPYKELLTRGHVPFGEYTGQMPRADRDALVRQYNEGALRALLVSSAGGEGLDLKETRLMQVLDPAWNEERTNQVIGRGVRFQGHAGLPEEDRNVRIQRFRATRPRKGLLENLHMRDPGMGVDEYLVQLGKDKTLLNNQFRALLENQERDELAAQSMKSRPM